MKNSFKILFAAVVVTMLVAAIGIGSIMAGQIDVSTLGKTDPSMAPMAVIAVAEDTVEWTDSAGVDLTHVAPGTTAVFYITDGALETVKSGAATFLGHGSTAQYFDVAGGLVGANLAAATSTSITRTMLADDYSTSDPATTPWTGTPVVTASTTGSMIVASKIVASGTVTLLAATGVSTTTVAFDYHVADSWAGSSTTDRRAKVVSTSDPQGEYVTISEVLSVGSATSSPDSQVFLGSIALSDDAATQGTNSDGIWVQDGDTLTVSYLNSDAAVVDSDTITVDAVKPTVASISPADADITSTINPTIIFDVTDTGAGIDSTPADAITIAVWDGVATTTIGSALRTANTSLPSFQPIADGYRVVYSQTTTWLTTVALGGFAAVDGTAFTWTLTATDKAGNTQSVTNDLTIDVTDPIVSSALTGTNYDTATELEGTSKTDSVKVVFSENLDATTVDAADFTVDGTAPSAATVGTITSNKNSVYLTVATLAADAKPEVIVTGVVSDAAGNAVDTALTTDTVTASDGLKSTITSTVSSALAVKDDEITVTVTSDEKLGTTGLIVSIIGPSGSAANELVTTTSPTTPLVREGDTTAIPALSTGKYGVSIQATDLGSNVTNNLTEVTAEVVAAASVVPGTATTVVTVAKGPIGDFDFDGVMDADDITSLAFSVIGTATTTITSVDASARTITVAGVTGTDSTATVTYHYVATETFEIDNSAPAVVDTLLFDPSDGVSTSNATPFISVKWDEDEYPGDSYTTVTLTKAVLTDPDDVETDILALMSTTDNKTFFYRPAADMAIGEHTLTVSADDTAGNSATDVSAKITITARALTEVALLPGWNLVSIPGTPADTAIDVVITPTEIDTVLTYDASIAGGWLTAIRDTESGVFAGTLTDITATQAYWVHTTNDEPIKVDIAGVEAGAASVPPALSLAKGWNLVPAVSLDPDFASIDADTYLSGLEWSKGYSYDRMLGKFSGFIPQATAATDTCLDEGGTGSAGNCIDSGFGYWIYLTESGVLIP